MKTPSTPTSSTNMRDMYVLVFSETSQENKVARNTSRVDRKTIGRLNPSIARL